MVYRIYVEKKPGFDVEANGLKNELTSLLGIKDLTGLRLLNRYDVEGIDEALFNQCVSTVFSEPPVDNTYAELPAAEGVSFAVEYLPGQFDQRAASAAECIQLISQGERPLVRSARVYLLEGALTPEHAANHVFTVLRLENTQQVIGTLDALRRDRNIIVHQQDVRGLRVLLHGSNHAASETAGTANIIVRHNLNAITTQLLSIKSTAIINHVHMEVVGDRVSGINNLILD